MGQPNVDISQARDLRLTMARETMLSPAAQRMWLRWADHFRLGVPDIETRHAWNRRDAKAGMTWQSFAARNINREAQASHDANKLRSQGGCPELVGRPRKRDRRQAASSPPNLETPFETKVLRAQSAFDIFRIEYIQNRSAAGATKGLNVLSKDFRDAIRQEFDNLPPAERIELEERAKASRFFAKRNRVARKAGLATCPIAAGCDDAIADRADEAGGDGGEPSALVPWSPASADLSFQGDCEASQWMLDSRDRLSVCQDADGLRDARLRPSHVEQCETPLSAEKLEGFLAAQSVGFASAQQCEANLKTSMSAPGVDRGVVGEVDYHDDHCRGLCANATPQQILAMQAGLVAYFEAFVRGRSTKEISELEALFAFEVKLSAIAGRPNVTKLASLIAYLPQSGRNRSAMIFVACSGWVGEPPPQYRGACTKMERAPAKAFADRPRSPFDQGEGVGMLSHFELRDLCAQVLASAAPEWPVEVVIRQLSYERVGLDGYRLTGTEGASHRIRQAPKPLQPTGQGPSASSGAGAAPDDDIGSSDDGDGCVDFLAALPSLKKSSQRQATPLRHAAMEVKQKPSRGDLASCLGLDGEEAELLQALEDAAESLEEAAAQQQQPRRARQVGPQGGAAQGVEIDEEPDPLPDEESAESDAEELLPTPEALRQQPWRELLYINSTEAAAASLGGEVRGPKVFDTLANKFCARLTYMKGRIVYATCQGRGHKNCRMWRNFGSAAELEANECMLVKWSLLGSQMTEVDHRKLGKDMRAQ